MTRAIQFIKEKQGLLKKLLSILILIAIIVLTRLEFKSIDILSLRSLLRSLSLTEQAIILLLGLAAFSFTAVYDIILSKYFKLALPLKETFKIGWTAQAFNNFIGFGGLTGTSLRFSLYKKKQVSDAIALKIGLSALVSPIVGVFMLVLLTIGNLGKLQGHKYGSLLLLICLYVPFYLFSGKLKLGRFIDEHSPFVYLTLKVKSFILLVSTIDWLAAALFFTYLVKLYESSLTYPIGILIYAISTIAGIASFLPGGIGTFDVACIYLFSQLNYDTNGVILSILIYRIVYYVVPWLVALFIMLIDFLREKTSLISRNVMMQIEVKALSFSVLFGGVVLILSVDTPDLVSRVHLLEEIVPKDAQNFSRITTLIIGILLIVLSKGLRERVKTIHHISIGLLLIGAVTCLIKGLDYEETLLMVFFAGFLFFARDYFTNQSMEHTKSSIAATIGLVTGLPLIYAGIYNATHGISFLHDTGAYSFVYLKENSWKFLVYEIVAVSIALLLQYSQSKRIVFTPVSEEDVTKFEVFIKKYPANEYTHLFYLKDKNVFYNSLNDVLFLYRPTGKYLLVLGDPIGNPEHFEDAVDELLRTAQKYNMSVNFYEVEGKNLELYSNQGFSFLKIGENAKVDLSDFSFKGKKNSDLRHIRNLYTTKNFQFEVVYPPYTESFQQTLKTISDEWLKGRKEHQFSLGFFDLEYLSREPVAILSNEKGIQAFASILPIANSQSISIDLMRFRNKAPSGTMDVLFISLFEWSKKSGYHSFNLGMAPLSNVGNEAYSHKKEKLVKYAYDFGNNIYRFHGLRSYKEKFHPEWSNVYIAYREEYKLISVLLALIKISN
ncbi:bifunctional lysylphosphatidylglycerol flippase/synthetase MprF [Carnobacterium antarcticum]|uniref:Phosphatidylglycerol lysyltransferase n=1 Tax=Carnobacterium antarcticum TaxID=2126436 RepID=A0ABW4NKN7_9LACT|nr:bifunctional lysylphosphatidylglycerol flippase/synthetase MprF [Carnobacterium sp. CP1]ALV21823.1 membrane protein [Carnobacterium sp. CP1]